MNRFRKFWLLLSFAIAGSAIGAKAQAKASPTPGSPPNFVGTWKLQRAPDTLTDAFVLPRQEQIEISQNGFELKLRRTVWIAKKTILERVYYTDGRGEINPFADDKDQETVSRTLIKDRSVITIGFYRKAGSAEKKKIDFRNVWTLSKDNKTLTFLSAPLEETSGPWSLPNTTYTYKRK